MRIPFPERVNPTYALIFAIVLCSIQVLEGTNLFFSGCVFCFLLIATAGFNIARGFPYPSGAFIGFNAFVTIILPMITKAILREPADSNLSAPQRTIEVYLLGMVAMLAAAVLSRRFRLRKAYITGMLPADNLRSAYIGCAVLSVILTLYLIFFSTGGKGTFDSFLVQANRFPILTFVLGVLYTFHRTDGRRSMTWPLFAMMIFSSVGAAFSFSKEQFLAPFFAWAVTVALVRYQLKWINALAFTVGLYFVVTFFVPYAQYGRTVESSLSRTQLAAYLLTHIGEVRENYAENSSNLGNVHYYNHRLILLDRLDILSGDAAIIDVTDREGAYGYRPIIEGSENIIPHIFFPAKPVPFFGNVYAHEIGIISPDDFTTGVSFSPSADAYREGRVTGVLVVEPIVFMIIFLVLDSVIGDVRLNPVGLLTTMLVGRIAYEGALWGAPLLIGQYLFTNVLAAFVCAYVLPMLGSIFNTQFLHSSPSLHRPHAPSSDLVTTL
jgi:hypothetical protein